VLIVEVLACRIVVLWAYDMCVLWGMKCTTCRPVKSTVAYDMCVLWGAKCTTCRPVKSTMVECLVREIVSTV
jgi:hypothetical protein